MPKYDVALSFAGQDRQHAKALADLLKTGGYTFFYDENEQADLWGKDLYEHLSSVYKDQARYCIMFLSEHYARELWPNHERKSAQARAFQENREYILPVRLDDTEIPGIPPTVGYLDLRSMAIEEVYEALVKKLSSTASRKTPSDDNNAPHSESAKEKSFNHESDQNVNAENSKTSLGQEDVSESGSHEKASNRPLKGFITYSHENTIQKDELRKRLSVMEQNNELITWDDGQLTPGDGALQEDILEKVADSDLLLYLVSAASLDSKNCNRELAEALKREIRVIPIILEHCDWQNHQLSEFEVLPDKGKSLNEWNPRSKGWQSVVEGIRKVANKMLYQVNAAPQPSDEANLYDQVFQRGNFLMMIGQMDMAIAAYSNVIELDSSYAVAYCNRGVAYMEKGELDRAIKEHTKAIHLDCGFANAYGNRAIAYCKKGEYGKAIADCNKAIQLDPDYLEMFYTDRGIVHCEKGDFDLSIKDFNKAIQINENYAVAYCNRGRTYMKKGEADKAIADYNKAIELKHDFAEAYYNRGYTYHCKDKYDLAIEDFTVAIHLNHNFAEAYYNRGKAYRQKGKLDRAVKDLTKAIKLESELTDAYYIRGLAYGQKEEFNHAIDDFDRVIQLKPKYMEVWCARGFAYEIKGEYDLAIRDYTTAIELNPNFAKAYYNRGNAYFAKGNFARAIEDYTRTIQLESDYTDAYRNRGFIYHIVGEIDRAIKDQTKAIELESDFAKAYYDRGNAYLHKGEFDRAIRNYTKAIELEPDFADSYQNRAVARFGLQEWENAIADLTTAKNLGADITLVFRNAFGSIENFERMSGIQLPVDIAALLTPPQI